MCPMAPIHEWNTTWLISDLASLTLAEQLPDRSATMARTNKGGGGGRGITPTKESRKR